MAKNLEALKLSSYIEKKGFIPDATKANEWNDNIVYTIDR